MSTLWGFLKYEAFWPVYEVSNNVPTEVVPHRSRKMTKSGDAPVFERNKFPQKPELP